MSFIKSKIGKRILFILILGLAALIFWKNTDSTGVGLDDFKMSPEQTKKIDKIFISPNDADKGYITLTKVAQDKWNVTNGKESYATDTQYVTRILNWLLPRLQVKNPVNDAAVKYIERDMALNATKVVFYEGENVLKTIFVGGGTSDGYATHMYLPGSDRPCVVEIPGFAGTLNIYFNTDINNWKTTVLIDYPIHEIASLEVDWPFTPEQSFVISNKGENASILTKSGPLKNVSNNTILTYLNMFRKLSRESGATVGINTNPKAKSEVLKGGILFHLKITSISGTVENLDIYRRPVSTETYGLSDKVGKLKDFETDSYFARLNNDSEFFVIQDIVFDKIMKQAKDFVRE
jgi:hypothetical protein